MRLTGPGFTAVQEALADAFGDATDFALIARCMELRLADVVSPNERLPDIVLAMIERAERDDAVEELIECARGVNTRNRLLGAITPEDLRPAAPPQEVARASEGSPSFKQRLVEALDQLDVAGREALAAHELSVLLEQASDDEVLTLLAAVLGVVRMDRPPQVLGELSGVFAATLRRRLGDRRPPGLKLELARVRLPRVDLSGLDLHEADLAFARLAQADLSNVNLWRSRAYGIDVSGAGLSRSNLEEARWHAALARGARFHNCRMVSCFFKEADLTGAGFQQSRLQGAHFERANLTGARFEQADISDATFKDAAIDEAAAASLSRAANWDNAHFDPTTRERISQLAQDDR